MPHDCVGLCKNNISISLTIILFTLDVKRIYWNRCINIVALPLRATQWCFLANNLHYSGFFVCVSRQHCNRWFRAKSSFLANITVDLLLPPTQSRTKLCCWCLSHFFLLASEETCMYMHVVRWSSNCTCWQIHRWEMRDTCFFDHSS